MDYLCSHTTALRLLRDPEVEAFSRPVNDGALYAPARPVDAFTVRDLAAYTSALRCAGEPLMFATSCKTGAQNRPAYVSKVFGMRLPAGSVFQLRGGLWCSGPELTLLQLASRLTEIELIVLLCEFMGTYSVFPGCAGGVHQRAAALTDPGRLASFLQGCRGTWGIQALRRASKFALPGSASPRETKLALRLCLPASMNGYGLRLLSMNESVAVDRIGWSGGERRVRKPDILIAPFEGSGARPVAFEYDGEDSHMTREGVLSDTVRGNELKAAGITEYRINKELYRNIDYMDDIVARARVEAGYPTPHRSAQEIRQRRLDHIKLYKQLEPAGRYM